MRDRFMTPSAVMPFILRERGGAREVLLHKRQNTGYGDGLWDCAGSGHVDAGESYRAAVVREIAEETGLVVQPGDVGFATLTHRHTAEDDVTYVNVFFTVERFAGEPAILEPHKCAALAWFPLEALPEDLLEDRRRALARYLGGVPFAEEGWDDADG